MRRCSKWWRTRGSESCAARKASPSIPLVFFSLGSLSSNELHSHRRFRDVAGLMRFWSDLKHPQDIHLNDAVDALRPYANLHHRPGTEIGFQEIGAFAPYSR